MNGNEEILKILKKHNAKYYHISKILILKKKILVKEFMTIKEYIKNNNLEIKIIVEG